MRKQILSLMACAAILVPTSGFCMEEPLGEPNESNWFRLRVVRSTDDRRGIKPQELGLFSEDSKLYFTSYTKERREITKSADLTEGLDGKSYYGLLDALNKLKTGQRSSAVLKQTESERDDRDLSILETLTGQGSNFGFEQGKEGGETLTTRHFFDNWLKSPVNVVVILVLIV